MRQSIVFVHRGPLGNSIFNQLKRDHIVDWVPTLDDARSKLSNTYAAIIISVANQPVGDLGIFFKGIDVNERHIPMRRIAILDDPTHMPTAEKQLMVLRSAGIDAGFEPGGVGQNTIPEWVNSFIKLGTLNPDELEIRRKAGVVVSESQARARIREFGEQPSLRERRI